MRRIVKTANRADSIWTTFLMVPALIMLFGAGLNMSQGKATPAEFANSATIVAEKCVGQSTPYTKATGSVIAAGAGKAFKVVSGQMKGASAPIYLQPGMARYSPSRKVRIKPYSHY